MPPGLGIAFNLKSKVIFPEIAMSSCLEIKPTEFIASFFFFKVQTVVVDVLSTE